MTKLLIVDDNPKRYANFVALSSRNGLPQDAVAFSDSANGAAKLLRDQQFDVLVVDMCLPMNSWESATFSGGEALFQIIREDPEIKVPNYIIGITAEKGTNEQIDRVFSSNPWALLRTSASVGWEEQLWSLVAHSIKASEVEAEQGYGVDIFFISALKDPEFSALQNVGLSIEDPVPVDSSAVCYRGKLELADGGEASVIAAHSLRMGAVEAALLTGKIISKFRPRIVVMIGICAGREDKVSYGDVIVGSPVWDYSLNSKLIKTPEGVKKVQYGPDYIGVDTTLLSRLDVFSGDVDFFTRLRLDWQGEKPRQPPSLIIAPSATGPAVIADSDVFSQIKEFSQRDVKGLEMEAYGVYSAARMSANPKPYFVSMKSVCDYADFLKDDRYQKYAAYTSANTATEFLRRFFSEIKAAG